MIDDLSSLLEYNVWANRLVADSLRPLPLEDYTRAVGGGWPSARATFVHLAGATRAWAERLEGREMTALPKEDQLPALEDAERMLNEADARIAAIVAALTPERLTSTFRWTTPRGDERAVPLWAILRHAVNHASYHRGQIASMVKRLGGKPAPTDLVRWAIERHAETTR